MRPIYGASPLLTLALLLSTPGLAVAEPAPTSLASLIADVADANQRLQELGAAVQSEQEGVNKALVDVQAARDTAVAAQRELELSQTAVRDADAAISDAQR
ncbi:MAG: peptidase M23, partial [Mycobacterium sp.]